MAFYCGKLIQKLGGDGDDGMLSVNIDAKLNATSINNHIAFYVRNININVYFVRRYKRFYDVFFHAAFSLTMIRWMK